MSKKGTVIKSGKYSAVILTEECEFKEISTTGNLRPGEQVTYTSADLIETGRNSRKLMYMAASVLIVFTLVLSAVQYVFFEKAYAYIGLESGKGLEIGINKAGKVVSVTDFNNTNQKTVRSVFSHIKLEDVLEQIWGGWEKNATPQELRQIAVSVYFPNQAVNPEMFENIQAKISIIQARKRIPANIYYLMVNEEIHAQAKKLNVSDARYLVWSACRNSGYTVDIDNISLSDPRLAKQIEQLAISVTSVGVQEDKAFPSPIPENIRTLNEQPGIPNSGAGQAPEQNLKNSQEKSGGESAATGTGQPEQPRLPQVTNGQPATQAGENNQQSGLPGGSQDTNGVGANTAKSEDKGQANTSSPVQEEKPVTQNRGTVQKPDNWMDQGMWQNDIFDRTSGGMRTGGGRRGGR